MNRTYPRDLPDLFEGGQIVWVGRYRQSGRTTLKITGKVGGERRSFEFPAELADSDRGSAHEFVERIWATRRVGYLIDQIDMSGQNKELIDELVSLSTRYGILTPYTSFLADERVPLHAAMQNARQAGENLVALRSVSGSFGVAQRDLKQSYMQTDKASQGGHAGTGNMVGKGWPVRAFGNMMGGGMAQIGRDQNPSSLAAAAPAAGIRAERGPGQQAAAVLGNRRSRCQWSSKASRPECSSKAPPGRVEDVLLQGKPLGRFDRQAGRGREGQADPPVQRRLLQPGPVAVGRAEPVPDLLRARHDQAGGYRLSHRSGRGHALTGR